MNNTAIDAGQRGLAEHAIRDQMVAAANDCASRYGHGKTTVSNLATAVGFSKAYVYKFFDSKQAIGEAICAASITSVILIAQIDENRKSGMTPFDAVVEAKVQGA
jgi:AcrR family transcriptional regulator